MTLLLTAALVALATACGGGAAAGGRDAARQPVTGVDWKVDSVTADGTLHRAPPTARLRIDEDGSAAGNLGCNGFSARVAVHGDRLTFGALRTTRMACDQARMTFERALARTLTGTLTGTADAGRLTLVSGHGDLVRLTRATPG